MHTDPPALTDAEEHILATAADRFPADASPDHVDREQIVQGRLVEREKAWVDPREIVGGEE